MAKKIKAIVCDSGVSKNQISRVETLDIGYGVDDDNGHGTQIVNVLSMYITPENITSIKILDENKECTHFELIQALKRCVEMDAKVICLSVSLDVQEYPGELYDVLQQLNDKGKIVVCSEHNKFRNSIPASLPSVLGVRRASTNNELKFDRHEYIQFEVPIAAVAVKSLDDAYVSFGGSSLACAVLSGIICEILSKLKINNTFDLIRYLNNNSEWKSGVTDKIRLKTHTYRPDSKMIVYKCLEDIHAMANLPFNTFDIYRDIKSKEEFDRYIKAVENAGMLINKESLLQIEYIDTFDTFSQYLLDQENENV